MDGLVFNNKIEANKHQIRMDFERELGILIDKWIPGYSPEEKEDICEVIEDNIEEIVKTYEEIKSGIEL